MEQNVSLSSLDRHRFQSLWVYGPGYWPQNQLLLQLLRITGGAPFAPGEVQLTGFVAATCKVCLVIQAGASSGADSSGPYPQSPIAAALWSSSGQEAELEYLVVSPESRSQGLGSFILATSHRTLQLMGVIRFVLEVSDANESAIRLYRKLGYELQGRRRAYYANGDDALVFALLASGAAAKDG